MTFFEKLRGDADINRIFDTVNVMNKHITSCHGRYHAFFVVEKTAYILEALGYNARTVELGKMAALLHDIGNIAGRERHARKSVGLAAVFLDEPDMITDAEKKTILHAIKDHSKGAELNSPIGAALVIADKIDLSGRRVLPRENIKPWYKNLLEIEEIKVKIKNNHIKINFMTTPQFSKKVLLDDYPKIPVVFDRATQYLHCTYEINFKI